MHALQSLVTQWAGRLAGGLEAVFVTCIPFKSKSMCVFPVPLSGSCQGSLRLLAQLEGMGPYLDLPGFAQDGHMVLKNVHLPFTCISSCVRLRCLKKGISK